MVLYGYICNYIKTRKTQITHRYLTVSLHDDKQDFRRVFILTIRCILFYKRMFQYCNLCKNSNSFDAVIRDNRLYHSDEN